MTKVKSLAALAGTLAVMALVAPSHAAVNAGAALGGAAMPAAVQAALQPGDAPVVTEVQYYHHHYWHRHYYHHHYYHHWHRGVRVGPVVIR